jgi:hypothetical protein
MSLILLSAVSIIPSKTGWNGISIDSGFEILYCNGGYFIFCFSLEKILNNNRSGSLRVLSRKISGIIPIIRILQYLFSSFSILNNIRTDLAKP